MPYYDYRCESCEAVIEVQHGMTEAGPTTHDCGGSLRKVFAPPAIAFIGDGFYVNEYGRGNGPARNSHRRPFDKEKGRL